MLSKQQAYSLLENTFQTDLDSRAMAARQLGMSGVSAVCEVYSKGVTTKQIAEYLGCTVHAVIVWEGLLKGEDKEALLQAKLLHAEQIKIDSQERMDAELERLDTARDAVDEIKIDDHELRSKALSDEAAITDVVLKKVRAHEIRAKLADGDIDRFQKRQEVDKGDSSDVHITQMIVSNAWLAALPDE